MQCVRLCRCALEQRPVAPFRFIQTSGLMMQLRLAQERRRGIGTSGLLPMQFFIAAALIAIHEDPSSGDLTGRPGE